MAAGADPNLRVCRSKTDCDLPALLEAGRGTFLSVIKLLVEAGASIWVKSNASIRWEEPRHIWSDSWFLPAEVQEYYLELCRERLLMDARETGEEGAVEVEQICAKNHTETNINAPQSFYYE